MSDNPFAQGNARSAPVSVGDHTRLHSGAPYWLMRDGREDQGTPLRGDASCDVAVVGAGITGAFIADALSTAGLRVIVLERDEPAVGCTGSSTAMLQYELDVELVELMARIGEEDALRAYRLCLQSLALLEQIALSLGGCGYRRKLSLYLASQPSHAKRLEREAETRSRHGLPASYMEPAEVRSSYGLASHGAIVCSAAGEVDPVRLTRRLLARACRHGARLATRTTVLRSEEVGYGVLVHTSGSARVRASWVVYATGCGTIRELGREPLTHVNTFAIASDRVDSLPAWLARTLIWESARPYAYLRTTEDGRVIFGGEDAPFHGAAARDRMLATRVGRLERRLHAMLPTLQCRTAFTWAGTLTESPDGLPCIGGHWATPGVIHAYACGANGLTFSAIAARIVRDAVLERANDDARIFSPERGAPRPSGIPDGRPPSRPAVTTRGLRLRP